MTHIASGAEVKRQLFDLDALGSEDSFFVQKLQVVNGICDSVQLMQAHHNFSIHETAPIRRVQRGGLVIPKGELHFKRRARGEES